jgi:hypothetical protein
MAKHKWDEVLFDHIASIQDWKLTIIQKQYFATKSKTRQQIWFVIGNTNYYNIFHINEIKYVIN